MDINEDVQQVDISMRDQLVIVCAESVISQLFVLIKNAECHYPYHAEASLGHDPHRDHRVALSA